MCFLNIWLPALAPGSPSTITLPEHIFYLLFLRPVWGREIIFSLKPLSSFALCCYLASLLMSCLSSFVKERFQVWPIYLRYSQFGHPKRGYGESLRASISCIKKGFGFLLDGYRNRAKCPRGNMSVYSEYRYSKMFRWGEKVMKPHRWNNEKARLALMAARHWFQVNPYHKDSTDIV